MIWRFNKALRYWFAPDGAGGEWIVYPTARKAFLDHHTARAIVRVGLFSRAGLWGAVRVASLEAEKRQARVDKRRAFSLSVL